ncbi:hypothetical protein KSP40_PGU001815 [Platanthera guangdongensis]|uniref:ATP-dependent DNA helicase n=1 Tax=Platanthera guangdongensis TaxID=2320717 RepID=A0ABR2MQR8_9ASPA
MEGERFYLRMLLNHVKGPKLFEDLKCVTGIQCTTFKQAAERCKLLEEDNSIRYCLAEARCFKMQISLRRLFAIILLYCEPTCVQVLWDENFDTGVIIWDETPMIHKKAFETVDRYFRDVLGVNLSFGDKVMIFGGDFRQLTPVVVNGTKSQIISASIVESYLWTNVHILSLTVNMRAHDDPCFSEFLLRMGNGDEPTVLDDMIQIPNSMVISWEDERSVNILIDAIFPELGSAIDVRYMESKTIITPLNEHVNRINEKCLDIYPGECKTYYSFDSVVDDTHNLYLPEFLNSINPGNLPPHELNLKKGSPIMLIRNIDPKIGLFNRTRLTCVTFSRNVIEAEILSGEFKGHRVFLPRIPLKSEEDVKLSFELTHKQFPVRLSYALTINKSQCQTISNVGVYLPNDVFSHAQLYVALPRGVSANNTKVMVKNDGMPDSIDEYYKDKDGNLPLPYHLRPKSEYKGFQKIIKKVPKDLSDDDQCAFAFRELFTPSKYLVPKNYDENAAAKDSVMVMVVVMERASYYYGNGMSNVQQKYIQSGRQKQETLDCYMDARGTSTEQDETIEEPQSSLLFPLFRLAADPPPPPPATSESAKWLSNPSFTFDVSSIPIVAVDTVPAESPLEESDEEEASARRRPSYELVSSPSLSEPERSSERREKRSRRKRKREQGRGKLGHDSSRKSGVRAWIGSDTKPGKDYYFDVHGDRDNLTFGCLYRMDIARYKLQNHVDFSEFDFEMLHHQRCSVSSMDIDHDLDVLDTKLKVGGRYYSVKITTLERHKGFKYVKIVDKKPSLIPGEYIPLLELHATTENGRTESTTELELEESWEDELVRRTRELNKMSRDFPHDENVWLAFAEFQDKIAGTQPQKAARLQTLEKKISILEKAVELNPDSEELLLCVLKAYQERDTTEALMERWVKLLGTHFDSVKLWKEFLLLRQGMFSQFKVADIRRIYGHAIQALSSACNKLCRQCQIVGSVAVEGTTQAQPLPRRSRFRVVPASASFPLPRRSRFRVVPASASFPLPRRSRFRVVPASASFPLPRRSRFRVVPASASFPLPRRSRFRVVPASAPFPLPRRSRFRAVPASAPFPLPRRSRFRAVPASAPFPLPRRSRFRAVPASAPFPLPRRSRFRAVPASAPFPLPRRSRFRAVPASAPFPRPRRSRVRAVPASAPFPLPRRSRFRAVPASAPFPLPRRSRFRAVPASAPFPLPRRSRFRAVPASAPFPLPRRSRFRAVPASAPFPLPRRSRFRAVPASAPFPLPRRSRFRAVPASAPFPLPRRSRFRAVPASAPFPLPRRSRFRAVPASAPFPLPRRSRFLFSDTTRLLHHVRFRKLHTHYLRSNSIRRLVVLCIACFVVAHSARFCHSADCSSSLSACSSPAPCYSSNSADCSNSVFPRSTIPLTPPATPAPSTSANALSALPRLQPALTSASSGPPPFSRLPEALSWLQQPPNGRFAFSPPSVV